MTWPKNEAWPIKMVAKFQDTAKNRRFGTSENLDDITNLKIVQHPKLMRSIMEQSLTLYPVQSGSQLHASSQFTAQASALVISVPYPYFGVIYWPLSKLRDAHASNRPALLSLELRSLWVDDRVFDS